ncbi:MAG: o-succinylbenzoate synthase [Deltaproteobacteria bacterium]|nr:o-succinylbenzoate synthase [Deltaproteobacteria bacterium]
MSTAVEVASGTLALFQLPLRRPFVTARATLVDRQVAILALRDERGRIGLGEAAPLPGTSPESIADVQASLQSLLNRCGPVIGARFRTAGEVAELSATPALPASARHAVDQALLDLLAARRGSSVARLLHPGARTRVPLHTLVSTPEEARAAAARGARALKIKVGHRSLDQDRAHVAEIRAAAGPEIPLRLDANGAWSEARAAEAITALSVFGLQCVEQPTRTLGEMARLRRQVSVPIAADEGVANAEDLEELIALGAADLVVLKPMLLGGLSAASVLARRCADAGLPVSVTASLESAIGRAGALEVAAAAPGTLWTCGFETGRLLSADLERDENGAVCIRRARSVELSPAAQGGHARLARREPLGVIAQLRGTAA